VVSGQGYNIMFYFFTRFIFYKNLILILSISFISCNIQDNFKTNFPNNDFDKNLAGKAPIYSQKKYWAEHPEKSSSFALLPKNYIDTQYNQTPNIDVFYIHPTLYTSGNRWNADINNKKLNQKIKNTAIKYQASVFAGIANIYAPHYRQMHIHSYSDLKNGYKAYDIAYNDVKDAFIYYWKYHNKSKKFILAGHSQGTNHAERLLKEIILQNDSIKNKLIISYLPGMPISKLNLLIKPCGSPSEINCFLSWRTLAENYFPEEWSNSDSISCINPITWMSDYTISNKEDHLGILFKNHKILYPKSVIAYKKNNVVWVKPIKIPFANFYKMKNYHIADYNLFWLNIRNNLKYRLKQNGYI
jgi:hypothetical protein